MKRVSLVLLSAIVFAVVAAIPLSLAATYEIDPSHSSVSFKIRHLVGTVRGGFMKFNGTIEMNPEDLTQSNVFANIEVSSIDTGVQDRDDHLRGSDFFDVEKYPVITFKSKRVEGGKLIGDLTMHGVTKEVELDYEYNGTAKDPWGATRAGFSATLVIDRKEFGINYNKALDQGGFLLGDEVTIEIDIEAKQK